MDATMLSSRAPPSSQTLILNGPTNPFLSPKPRPAFLKPTARPRFLTVRSAISRGRKEETVETVKEQLENCHLIAGIHYKGFTVKQFQDLRRSLPETSKLLVAKNTLVYKAIEGTPFQALKPCMKGMNVWLFVHSEEIPAALKPFRTFQKENKLENNDYAGAVFEGTYYPPEDIEKLETMPTREEIYSKLLGVLKNPASNLVSTIQAPARELLMVLKAYVKKLEDEAGDAQ